MRRWISRLAAFALPCVTWFAATAAPGDWDRSFAQAGRLAFTLPGITLSVRDWVQQPDGKVVVVGHTTGVNSIENNDYIAARFNLDGSPDTGFDGDGYVRFDFGSPTMGMINVQRQADGKLLIVGQAGPALGDATLLRLNVNGSTDSTYGLAGQTTITFPNNGAISNPAMTLAPNGDALVVSGFGNTPQGLGNIAVTRVKSTGSLDTTFGTNGTAFIQSTAHLFSYFIQVAPDGKVVVAGETGPYNDQRPIVARLTSTGQPDASFGTGGLAVLPFLPGDGYTTALGIAPNGQVVVAANQKDTNGSLLTFVAKLTNAGTPDPAFGSDGRIVLLRSGIASLGVESDGKIVTAGAGGDQFSGATLSRYNSDGSPDVSFGTRGIRLTDFATGNVSIGSELRRLYRNGDGTYSALVAMYDRTTFSSTYALARFVSQGATPGVLGIHAEFEGPGGGGFFSVPESTPTQKFFVYRTGGTDGAVSVQYRTVSGTAIAGKDFVAKTGTVTLNDGETQGSFDVQVIDDSVPEANFPEEFHIELFAPTGGAGLSKQRSTIELNTDQDYGQRIALYPINGSFIESGTGRFLLARSGDMQGPLTLNYVVTSGSATAGTDVDATGGSVTWAANQGGFKEFTVPLINDSVVEGKEDFTVTVTDPNGVAQTSTVTASIIDDDDVAGLSTVAFDATGVFVTEGEATANLTVHRLGDATQALSVPWSIGTGSGAGAATAGDDYISTSGTVSWNANDRTPKTISIPLVNDSTYESIESFSPSLNLPFPVTAPDFGNATVIIKDDDGTPSQAVITLGPGASVSEAAGTLSIPVTLTGSPSGMVMVDAYVSLESTSVNDLGALSASAGWNAGESGTKQLVIPIVNDARDEIDETFTVYLRNPTGGATLGNAQSRFTILDDDPTPPGPGPIAPSVQPTVNSVTVSEGQRTVTVDLRRVGDTTDPLNVGFTAADGTASSPDDYVFPFGQVNWNANETAIKHVELQINGDTIAEPTETLTLYFVANTFGAPSPAVSVPVTITDDDAPTPPANVALINATQTVSEAATSVTVQVGRSGNTSGASSVDYLTTPGTAGTSDFTASTGTLTWAANDASLKSITIPLLPDTTDEPDETFTLTLGNASSGTQIDTATSTITIQDDDAPPPPPPPVPAHVGFSAATQSVSESATTLSVQVSRIAGTTGASTVSYATAAGTAGSSDFTASNGTLTWAASDTAAKTITIALLPDTTDEPDETFTLTLSNPSSGTLLDTAATTITIQDDDAAPPPNNGGGSSSSSGGGGGGGGGSESLLSMLALASLLVARRRRAA